VRYGVLPSQEHRSEGCSFELRSVSEGSLDLASIAKHSVLRWARTEKCSVVKSVNTTGEGLKDLNDAAPRAKT
jgi:hypothetical protein